MKADERTAEPTAANKKTGLDLLREPFPENQISWLPKPYRKDSEKGNCRECGGYHGLPAMHLPYVGHAALTDRLLDADPAWCWEPLSVGADGLPVLDSAGGLWIKLTVCGVTRLGYGDAPGKGNGGDAMKERIGDALRNAAMRFGAALELWHKGDLHADDEGEGDGGTAEGQPQPRAKAPATPQAKAKPQATDQQQGPATPLGAGPKRLLDAKAKAAGLSPEEVDARFGEVTMANLNAVLSALTDLANGGA